MTSKVDREAFERAIEIARQESPAQRRQIDEKLASEPWEEVGRFAAYCCQDAALRLKPWQVPPCWLRSDDAVRAALATPPPDLGGRQLAAGLVRQLLAAGLSRYEPNPLRALAAVEAKAATASGRSRASTVC